MAKKKDNLPTDRETNDIVQTGVESTSDNLFADLVGIIENCKQRLYSKVNSGLVMMFWEVGKRINDEILKNERAEYGKQIIATLSQQLQIRYGANFEYTNLTRIMKFAKEFTDAKILATVSQELSWGHIKDLLPLKSMDEWLYYANEVANGNLGVRDLRHLIDRKAYERRDIANMNITHLSQVPFNTFKDPYLLMRLICKTIFWRRI